MLWFSDDFRHFIVPVGPDDYMRLTEIKDFLHLGLPDLNGSPDDVDWVEYDVSRFPSNLSCKSITITVFNEGGMFATCYPNKRNYSFESSV